MVVSASRQGVRALLELEFCILVCRFEGTFYAYIPELGAWNTAPELDSAIDGAMEAAIGMLEIAEERGRLAETLRNEHFKKTQGVYRVPRETRRQLLRDFTAELTWKDDDPDKNKKQVLLAHLAKIEVLHDFALTAPTVRWQPQYEEAPAQISC
jgi:hypothetical protein